MRALTLIAEYDNFSIYQMTTETGVRHNVFYSPDEREFYYPREVRPTDAAIPEYSFLKELLDCGELSDAEELNEYLTEDDDMFHDCYHCDGTGHAEDMYEVNGGWVCGDCRDGRYFTCDKCDNLTPNDEAESVGGAGDELVCNSCAGIHTSFCSICDVRYWDMYEDDHDHEDEDSCACEPHEPEFSIAAIGPVRSTIDSDTQYDVTVNKEAIPYHALASTVEWAMGELRSALIGPETEEQQRARALLSHSAWSINSNYLTREGKWSKRLRSAYYKTTRSHFGKGVSLPPAILSEIGRRTSEAVRGVDMTLTITRDLNRSAKEMGHAGSCWWTDFSESRCALKTNGGFALLDGTGTIPQGRAWVLPCKVEEVDVSPHTRTLLPTHEKADAYLVFNEYGTMGERAGARAFAALIGWEARTPVTFNPNRMYINGESAVLVLPPDASHDIQWEANSRTMRQMRQHAPRHPEEEEALPQRTPSLATVTGGEVHGVYSVGDPDPSLPNVEYCVTEREGLLCTLERGHDHPQHVAGDGNGVLAVWDVEDRTPVYSVGDPDPSDSSLAECEVCQALSPQMYVCTLGRGHDHPQHVAGNGTTVSDVWDVEPAVDPVADAARNDRAAQAAQAALYGTLISPTIQDTAVRAAGMQWHPLMGEPTLRLPRVF